MRTDDYVRDISTLRIETLKTPAARARISMTNLFLLGVLDDGGLSTARRTLTVSTPL